MAKLSTKHILDTTTAGVSRAVEQTATVLHRLAEVLEQGPVARLEREPVADAESESPAVGARGRITPIRQPSLAVIERQNMKRNVIRRLDAPKVLLLVTHQKAGTHMIRYFLANYFRLVLAGASTVPPVTYDDLQRMFPNMRRYVLEGRKPFRAPQLDLGPLGFSDFVFTHVHDNVGRTDEHFHRGPKIICVRNPLDYLISIWHYNYVNRKEPDLNGRTLHDVMDAELHKWAAQVAYLKALYAVGGPRYVWATYESLFLTPEEGFRAMVKKLGLPFDETKIDQAIERGRFDAVRKEEQQRGKAIVAPISGNFTRKGSVGQWREHLDARDINRAREVLATYGHELEEFQLT